MITTLDYLKAEIEKFRKRPVKKCLIWPHGKHEFGYGHVKYNGKTTTAHRVAYELYYGEKPPKGILVRHTCDNASCFNPHHLKLGTYKENSRDMFNRGRHVGSSSWQLTEDDVREIIRLLRRGRRQVDIAAQFGISQGAVSHIRTGRTWEYIPRPWDK